MLANHLFEFIRLKSFFQTGFPQTSVDKPLKLLLDKLKIKETEPKAVIKKLKSVSEEELLKVAQEMGEVCNLC